MPLDPSIALRSQAPAVNQQNPMGMLMQLLQLKQMQESGQLNAIKARHAETMLPLEMQKMQAEIANIPAQEEQRRAAALKTQMEMQGAMQRMGAQNQLAQLFNPNDPAQYTQGSAPNQMFSTEDQAREAMMRAEKEGRSFSGVSPNRGTLQSLLAQADPKAFVDQQLKGLNPTPQRPVVLGPGAGIVMPGQDRPGFTQPFAPQRPDQAVVVVQTPEGPRYAPRSDAAGQPAPAPAGAKPPAGYRFSADGETLEPIPGGPKSKPAQLPSAALRMQQAELDAIGVGGGIKADMAALSKQIDDKKLNLGLIGNYISQGRNLAGISSETSRNYASFRASLEKLRNDSLRLNKGTQTEGDAIRAWNELLSNVNDEKVVKQRLGEIQDINERAIGLRKMNIDAIRKNYGADALETTGYEKQSPAVGGKEKSILQQADEILGK
jgi:hypothetical protein